MIYLIVCAFASFILFAILLIHRARQITKTQSLKNAGHFTVILSWLLLIIFFASISGIAYGATYPATFAKLEHQITGQKLASPKPQRSAKKAHYSQRNQQSAKHESTNSHRQKSDNSEVTWDPTAPKISGSYVNILFNVPKNTSVVIRGHVYHQKYGEILADPQTQRVSIQFNYTGTYDVIINHNGQETTKILKIN
ncbi:hypothetical protein [uncultured Limosilactobacillus sp.]|uniref:hypothetical protein n=1 Tax=uncultured Limosilactobacillus sp. TaxID=2837629 RepID=UPI0025F5A215|nr:hypothetical protein [uncultured Limosilactobacillus sp.]